MVTFDSIASGGGRRMRERQPGQRDAGRRHGSLASRGIAAGLAAAALVAPAAAGAKPSLVAQAKATMQRQDTRGEARHKIPFKRGTNFTIACRVRGQYILCREHAGPGRCTSGRPWVALSESWPIVHGRLGLSTSNGLTVTLVYCPAA